MKTIKVLEFSEYPGLRHCSISDDSGEAFYHSVLNYEFKNAYESDCILTVDLDDNAGYAPSFLDEAFGNLIYDFGLDTVKKYLKIISIQEPDILDMLEKETYPQWVERKDKLEKPKKTKTHKPWFYIEDGELKTTT